MHLLYKRNILLYQFHQSPPAAFVGFRTVYSQAMYMYALHLLLYQIHQTPTGCFCWIQDCVQSQAMDALHFLLYQIHQTPPGCFCWIQDCVQPSHGCFAFATLPFSSKSNNWGYIFTACWWILVDLGWFLAKIPWGLGYTVYSDKFRVEFEVQQFTINQCYTFSLNGFWWLAPP